MKFFVPGEKDAESAWDRMRQACGASVDTRPEGLTDDFGPDLDFLSLPESP